MTKLLDGKVAVVTGAAHPQGIGHAIVSAFTREGATVVITDLKGAAGLDETDGIACDVTDPAQVDAMIADIIATHGKLDIVVNNAGVGVGSPDFLEITAQEWNLSLQVNVIGMANVCRAAIPQLRERGGSIINVASLAGLGAMVAIPACYTASKFAAIGLTKQLAIQYAADNIRCNALCPGSVVTQMHAKTLAAVAQEHGVSLDEAQALEDASIPLGRSAQPQEIGDAAVYLASDQSRYITGITLPVAGGMAPAFEDPIIMPKLTEEQLARYQAMDREAFDFADESIAQFFARAAEQGYNLDTTGFLAHPGFFQAPHRQSLEGVDIAMVGSSLDLGAIGLAGARHGPQHARHWSRNYGPMNDVTGHIPFEQCSIIDYGDVVWSATDLQTRLHDIYEVFLKLGQAGAYTLNCGGEHTTTFGCLWGLSEAHDDSFGVIHIDAHSDTMASWGGDKVNDGSIFRQAVLHGFIDPERTVQIGIRGRSNFLWEFSHDTGMTVITADEVFERGTDYVIAKAREVVGDDKTYFSFDVDGLDSNYMMGTTGPEPFGLTPRQVRDIIHGCRGIDIVGADMVELNPNRDSDGKYGHVAAALFFELLCLLADSRTARMDCGSTQWTP